MSNDSSILVIDSLELDSITGGMPVPPPGGLTGQTSMNIPGGGSLTCPAGTSPYHEKIKATAAGATSLEGGLIKINLKGGVDIQHDGCVVPTKPQ